MNEPTAAEAARSLVAGASSISLHTAEETTVVMVGSQRPDPLGRLLLSVPESSPLVAQVRSQVLVATQAFLVDVAPIAVRERERARLELFAWLRMPPQEDAAAAWASAHPAGSRPAPTEVVLRLDPRAICLQRTGREAVEVDPQEYAGAGCDPLAGDEAELLQHLASDHPGALEVFARMLPPGVARIGDRIVLLRLDRHRLVLRLEREGAHTDVSLLLPGQTPAATAEDALSRVRMLLCRGQGGCCSARRSATE